MTYVVEKKVITALPPTDTDFDFSKIIVTGSAEKKIDSKPDYIQDPQIDLVLQPIMISGSGEQDTELDELQKFIAKYGGLESIISSKYDDTEPDNIYDNDSDDSEDDSSEKKGSADQFDITALTSSEKQQTTNDDDIFRYITTVTSAASTTQKVGSSSADDWSIFI